MVAADEPPLVGAAVDVCADDSLSPITEMAFPETVTGASTSRTACEPDPIPSEPSVVAADEPPLVGAVDVSADDSLSPMTETALPTTDTGALSSTTAWVPERRPSSPVVSAAVATVAPNSVRPPAITVPQRARLTNVCMKGSPLN